MRPERVSGPRRLMHHVARVSAFVAFVTAVALSTPACSDGPDKWSHLFQGVTLTSMPTLVGPDGQPLSTTWSGNATTNQDELGITLNAKNGMRLSLEFANPQASTTFTSFKLRTFDDIFADPPGQGQMRIAFLDASENDVASATGTVRLEELDAPATDTLEAGSFRLKLTIERLVLKTSSGSTSSTRTTRPLASDGGAFVLDETGGYAFTGKLEASGSEGAFESSPEGSSGGSSGGSSSSSSSGGTKDCSAKTVWKCASDGQATPMCQAACNYGYDTTQGKQTCQVLNSMISQPSCCPGC